MTERRQDTWFVSVTFRNAERKESFKTRGILELPYPMTASEASGYALSVQVRDVIGPTGQRNTPREIHAVIWSKRSSWLAEGRHQVTGAIAEYDADLGIFMQNLPWPNETAGREELGSAEGAKFHPLDW